MSTQTQVLLFGEADVAKMPRKYCVGRVGTVGEGHVSKSGKYIVQPIEIAGLGASPYITYYFLYRPEWLVPGFGPDSLDSSTQSVYRRHIAVKKSSRPGAGAKLSALEGLCGSPENFIALQQQLLGAGLDPTDEGTIATVENILREFFANQEDVEIGYVLKQGSEKTDETDSNGKAIYQLTDRYEVDSFFFVTPDQLAYYRTKAQNSKGAAIICFDDESPY